MAVTLSSTTDSESEVTRALEAAGQTVETIETITNEPDKPVDDKKKTEVEAPAPAEKPASDEAGKPGEGKTAAVTETVEETEEQEEQEKPKKGGGAEKKIDKLTKETRQLAEEKAKIEGRLEELTRQNEELRSILPKPGDEKKPAVEEKKPEDTKPVEAKPKPVLGDYDTHEDWIEALTDWKLEQKQPKPSNEVKQLTEKLAKLESDLAEKEKKNTELNEGQARLVAFHERNAETIASYPDWKQVSEDTNTVPISAAVQDLILDLDGGADVVHYLATHREEAEKVLKVTNFTDKTPPKEVNRAIQMAGIEFSRIHALAVAEKTAAVARQAAEDAGEAPPVEEKPVTTPKPKQQVSKTPAPIKPSAGAAAPTTATPYEQKMSHKEYMEWHRKAYPNRYPQAAASR